MQGHGSPPPIPPRHLKPSLSVLQSSDDVASIRNPTFDHLRQHEEGNEINDDTPEITTNVDPTPILGVGTGLNAVRFVAASSLNVVDEVESMGYYYSIPDSIIGQGSVVQGTVTFQKLLRLDGRFEGKLISTGTVVIGPTGMLHGDLVSAMMLTVEGGGKIVGNVTADKVVLKGKSMVQGDVCCKGMQMDMDAMLVGHVNIHPHAPNALSISLDPPLVVGNDNQSSSSSSSSSVDTPTATLSAAKAQGTSAVEDTNTTTRISDVIVPTTTTSEGGDDSASTVAVTSSLPLPNDREGDVPTGSISCLNPSGGSDLTRHDSMGAISWREGPIVDDG